ncbi:MAG: hypothetical protein R2799_08220 [Crocinitomicaceae bacterium]
MRSLKKDIPKLMKSDLTDQLFHNCLMCDIDLMESRIPYMIEKAFKRAPDGSLYTIFEFAICMNCAQKTQNQLSRESLTNIQNYFARKRDLFQRNEEMFDSEKTEFEDWTNECILSGNKISECEEFQVLAMCQGNQMEMGLFPYAISGAEAENMQELLSEKTKDELDDFMNTHLDLPPELKMLLEESSTLVLI